MPKNESTSPGSRAASSSSRPAAVDYVVAPQSYDKTLFVLALLTTLATFPMIFMGGLVTSHHAGMSVPDWPNSYHYNMFLFPPRLWIGGIFYEHTHRLMGTVVGLFSMALAAYAWRGLCIDERPAGSTPRVVRWIALLVLLGVIFQGVLGGLRVVFVNLDLAIVHACFAQAFFCLAAFATILASRWWINTQSAVPLPRDRILILLSVLTVGIIFAQLIVGATMRHFDAGLAIPDLPLAYGHWLPPTSSAGLDQINKARTWDLNLDPVTLQQVWLAFAHRIGAVLVSLMVLALTGHALYHHYQERALRNWSITILALLVAQVTLGVLTVLYRKPADVASLHVATGALLLVCTFTLTTCALRLMRKKRREPTVAQASASATKPTSRGTVPAWH